MSKKCINCGAELEEDELFCGDCGTKQIEETQTKVKKEKITKRTPVVISEADKDKLIQAEAEAKVKLEAKREEKIKKQEERKNNPKHLAIISLILGIVSYITMITVAVPIVTSILGIVFGFKGLKSEKKKTSIAGIVINISFIVLLIAIVIFA